MFTTRKSLNYFYARDITGDDSIAPPVRCCEVPDLKHLQAPHVAPDPYPYDDASCAMTLEEIGAVLGITRQTVKQIECRALGKIRLAHKRHQMLSGWDPNES